MSDLTGMTDSGLQAALDEAQARYNELRDLMQVHHTTIGVNPVSHHQLVEASKRMNALADEQRRRNPLPPLPPGLKPFF